MRRLAIVDLAGGQQPFTNETGTIQLVANGEIYNFPRAAAASSRRTATRSAADSDIEVLVHAYEEWGERLPAAPARHVRAGALGRRARGRCSPRAIAPARSRSTGRRRRAGLLLASEVKALLVRPEVSRELDPEALDQFLTYEYVLAPRTMLKGVHKLPAGALSALSRRRRCTVQRYWDAAAVPLRRVDATTTPPRRCARRCSSAVVQPDDGRRAARRVPVRRHRLEHASSRS